MSKSGFKPSNEALKCVHYSLLSFAEPEALTEHEQNWILNCVKGGIIFARECELESAYEYDIRSVYPAKMSSAHFTFPVKQGEFTEIDIIPAIVPFGIYRVVVSRSGNPHLDKLFRFNESNFYTHTDIQTARLLDWSWR